MTGASDETRRRPVAVVTGVGRRVGIGAAIAERLGADGFDVAFTWWSPYDARMSWGADASTAESVVTALGEVGARAVAIEADLEQPESAAAVFDAAESALGPVSVLVMSHCESVDSSILDTTVESFDRHMAVNARATWLLVREFGRRFTGPHGSGRIVALTSDHTAFNLPYGSSKGALDRIVLAASREFAELGVAANVVDPGPTDTGWMDADLEAMLAERTPLGRVGRPSDAANLVAFLCSPDGGWMNGQRLRSDGGLSGG